VSLAGEAACLSAALSWAVSLAIFSRPIGVHGARTVNLAKCLLGASLQGLTVLALGLAGSIAAAPSRALVFLAASGVVGLTLGDTALFAAVARIGVHRSLLLHTLSPIFAAAVAAAWQGEIPTPRQGLGALVVLAGIALVVAPERDAGGVRSWATAGILAGVLAAMGQGAGVVLAKAGAAAVPVVAASFVRLATAAVGLLLFALIGRRLGRLRGLVSEPGTPARLFSATFLGTYTGLFLMMAGVALAPASIAAVLLATTPVFSLIVTAILERRAPDLRGALGTVLAVAGVAVLVGGRHE
jgi:drug/metabolite transporter (DMT)-like permease